ncbi:ATP-dependent DNA helicase Q1-like [Planococcus citri]|uniref:ATP-dependent DNA helicase Q1-like n=1 Tax=Planococcus citri TaxID=170843 RepID=UPI0031F9219A
MAGQPEDLEEELKTVSKNLREVEAKIRILQEKREELRKRKDLLADTISLQKSKELGSDSKWDSEDYPWYPKLSQKLKDVFKISSFRPNQLAAINATLSKQDVIVIMPTGGGKSLCFQLPALMENGFTLVISPMLSLMEDQIMTLKSLSIKAEMFQASTTVQESAEIQKMMIDAKSGLKLLYVTPEKLAKSKRFMSKLQKAHSLNLLSRIAIDEVHCCSQWGHDFRTDYQFLSVLKDMFQNVPIIGLTATATTKVILDVQKMLSIQGCLIFKSSFNRPNLYYEVREKPSSQKECIDQLEDLLKHRFKNMSGIIYTTSIKDCEDLRQELRKRGCKVSGYHAQLESSVRSNVHQKWLSGEYQAVVATIAFGLGIDKPDVRFVIHHSLSKSMENFYQESGRAGRDGRTANCILYFRFADIFKLSTMVFTQQTGLRNLYSIVDYCLNPTDCRRKMIASHFDETWESTDCNKMCDHCENTFSAKKVDVSKHCLSLLKILLQAFQNDTKLTAQMLIDVWYGKTSKIKSVNVSPPSFSRETGERIVAFLLINDYLKEDFHFTPYSTISYIKKGPKGDSVKSGEQIAMLVRDKKCDTGDSRSKISSDSTSSKTTSNKRVVETTENSKCKRSKLICLDDSESD